MTGEGARAAGPAGAREYRERLIDEVKRCPVLYDTRHENHRDIDVRDRCWADIAHRLGANSEVLKREWKILRDSLRQSIKKNKRGATTKAGAPCKKWRFHARMAFVLPYMTRRSRQQMRDDIKVDTEGDSEGDPDDRPASPAPACPPQPASDLDALDLFFASVCQSAKRLPRAAQAQLKRQVLDALVRAEQAAYDPAPAPAPDLPHNNY